MAADLSFVFKLPASAKTTFEMLTNPNFLNEKIALAQSGHYSISGNYPNLVVEVTRTVVADLPDLVRKFVGENLVVQEIQNWKEISTNNYIAEFKLKIPNAPVDISGQIKLIENQDTEVSIIGKVKVNLPIFGGAAEPKVVDTINRVLSDEAQLCKGWITKNA